MFSVIDETGMETRRKSRKTEPYEALNSDNKVQMLTPSTTMIISKYFATAPAKTESHSDVSDAESKVIYKQSGIFLFSSEHIQKSANNINPLRNKSYAPRYNR
jgi:hypothetical protein